MSHSQVNIFIIFITFYLENFNADVAIMMKMWDIATSNQGWRGLASFIRTMNDAAIVSFFIMLSRISISKDTYI